MRRRDLFGLPVAALAGARVAVARAKPRAPRDLVLVHGGLNNAAGWGQVVEGLQALRPAPFLRILCPDIPGCGTKRGQDTSGLSRLDVIDGLNAEVERAGFTNAVLVGHSVACSLLPEMAKSGLYSQLCFLTGPVAQAGDIAEQIFGHGAFGSEPGKVGYPMDPAKAKPGEMNRLRFCNDMTPEQAAAFLADCANDVVPRRLMTDPAQGFDPDVLPRRTYIIALKSSVFPVPWQQKFAARLGPGVRIEMIDAGHEAFITRPDLVVAQISSLAGRS